MQTLQNATRLVNFLAIDRQKGMEKTKTKNDKNKKDNKTIKNCVEVTQKYERLMNKISSSECKLLVSGKQFTGYDSPST